MNAFLRGLAVRAFPHNAGPPLVWRRSWSAEDDTVVSSHGQRLSAFGFG
jgi:hypothetical protein